jgi:predicted AAA+ superfamily ATPase
MLKRKIADLIEQHLRSGSERILLIDGARQVGKTYIIRHVGKKLFSNFIEINMLEDSVGDRLFENAKTVDDFYLRISAIKGELMGKAEDTLIFIDEIQECFAARSAFKYLALDGRCDVVGSGSLLGIRFRETGDAPSLPVGYERQVTMHPLDFEEFLWALGYTNEAIEALRGYAMRNEAVPHTVNETMMRIMREYLVVGGMPAVVQTFVDTRQMNTVLHLQRGILSGYEEDMVKYAEDRDKPLIRECFRSIPRQLSKENKKFQYSLVKKGSTAAKFAGSLQWIEDAGIIRRCYNLTLPELPLDGNAIQDIFKVYMVDSGLLIAMLEDGTQFDVLQGNLCGYKGAIFENLAADILAKMGRKLYYYHKDSGLEIDFVIRYAGQSTLLEVKASTGNTKSAKTVLNHPEKYHVGGAIKLGDYNVGRSGQILTLPFYMAFLLTAF